MKNIKIYVVFFSLVFMTLVADSKPKYANYETKKVIEAMVEAHGGLDKWKNLKGLSYTTIMHNNYHGKNELAWWAARESFDQKSRQVHQDWFLDDAEIGFDGNQVWADNWKKANPPRAMVYFFYYFVNLPWITQDDGVQLSEVSSFEWPGHGGKTYHQVKLTFSENPAIGKSELDYFVLYIDKETHLLAGYQYAVGNREFLDALGQPPERKLFGPLWRLIVKNQTVDGLVFPAAFRTMPEADERIVGNHLITDIDVNTPFDFNAVKAAKTAKLFEVETK